MPTCQKCGKEVAVVSSLGNCATCMSPNAKFYTPDGKELIQGKIKKEGNKLSENNDVESLKEELENEKTVRENLESTLKLIAEKEIEKRISELNIPESEKQYFRENPEALKGYSLGKKNAVIEGSGKGTIPMTAEMLAKEKFDGKSEKREFDSQEELIDDLRAKGDSETLNALWVKGIQGLRENPRKTLNFEYQPTHEEIMIKSSIAKALEIQNKAWRKSHGYKESE